MTVCDCTSVLSAGNSHTGLQKRSKLDPKTFQMILHTAQPAVLSPMCRGVNTQHWHPQKPCWQLLGTFQVQVIQHVKMCLWYNPEKHKSSSNLLAYIWVYQMQKPEALACVGRDCCKTEYITVKQKHQANFTQVSNLLEGKKMAKGTMQLIWKRKLLIAQIHSHWSEDATEMHCI